MFHCLVCPAEQQTDKSKAGRYKSLMQLAAVSKMAFPIGGVTEPCIHWGTPVPGLTPPQAS